MLQVLQPTAELYSQIPILPDLYFSEAPVRPVLSACNCGPLRSLQELSIDKVILLRVVLEELLLVSWKDGSPQETRSDARLADGVIILHTGVELEVLPDHLLATIKGGAYVTYRSWFGQDGLVGHNLLHVQVSSLLAILGWHWLQIRTRSRRGKRAVR